MSEPIPDASPDGGGVQPGPVPGPAPIPGARSPMSDGEWHRLHPLTPLLRGGLFLVVVAGLIVANLRDRLIFIFLPWLDDDIDVEDFEGGDPIDWIVANNLYVVALLVVLAGVLLLIAIFYMSWRFHTFRITGDDVEVRSGVLFRTHRRAPLDRVQGVNLTRPMVARLMGMAKLEVVGAGLDSNVKLEYLSTANAEEVRSDILRLASGRRLAEARADAANTGVSSSRRQAAASVVSAGITGLIAGAEDPVDEPESVVHIPIGRLVLSRLLSSSTLWLIAIIVAIIVGSMNSTPWLLFTMIPALLGFGAYWVRTITRSLRYSIAPTPSGVRITFGLFTTITEILPPGRVHAVEVSQSILWRGFGWWEITVNRLSGRGMADGQADQFTTVLPVGRRADVERVLRLLLPDLPETEWPLVFEHGILGAAPGDPYTNTPRRARLLRPLSWKRNGFLLAPDALFLRRGMIWRKLAVFPLARLQSIGIHQGPLDRALSVAGVRAHTIAGRVYGGLGILDRDAALDLFERTAAATVTAVAVDRSHRWAGEGDAPAVAPVAGPAAGPAAGPVPGPVEAPEILHEA